ncbi:MAG: acetyl ornithine aminotransferase family protein [Deltaproteobacteria bacterium]|nr:acetyl ornithine aminotransferase family protein [Deltaproteobacteria bacterium]
MSRAAPHIRTKLPGPKAAAWITRDARSVSPSYTRIYPLVAARGRGCWIDDVDGNRFLDFTAGIAVTSTGHCHPKVVAAIAAQSRRLLHMSGTDFYYAPQVELSERLAACAPGRGAKKVFLCNSGAESIEGAMKLARWHTGRKQFVAFLNSFHGRTFGALSLSASKRVQRERFFPLLPGVVHAPYPDPYHLPSGSTPDDNAAECLAWLRDRLFATILPPDEVAAIVVEPIQGEGGYAVPPRAFFTGLRTLCDEHGILLVADEVQSGMGRTGKMFAIEHFDIAPDIICTAKGIASGLPLGAIIAKAELMDWGPGSHASTFGGNPVACAAAIATIDLLERGLMANAAKQGKRLRAGLERLQARHARIGDVRGIGLMVGMELVKTRAGKEPAKRERDAVIQAAFRRGLLLLGCGANTVRFCPPLIVTASEVDTAIAIVDQALRDL